MPCGSIHYLLTLGMAGRSRYQQKNYEGALEAFSEAVKQSSGHLRFTALDHRAATYEKLDQLQSALRDSKQMIDLKPELAKVSRKYCLTHRDTITRGVITYCGRY